MTYTETQCWKCDLDILVKAHDLAPHNYCTTCAWDKLSMVSDNQTVVHQ